MLPHATCHCAPVRHRYLRSPPLTWGQATTWPISISYVPSDRLTAELLLHVSPLLVCTSLPCTAHPCCSPSLPDIMHTHSAVTILFPQERVSFSDADPPFRFRLTFCESFWEGVPNIQFSHPIFSSKKGPLSDPDLDSISRLGCSSFSAPKGRHSFSLNQNLGNRNRPCACDL